MYVLLLLITLFITPFSTALPTKHFDIAVDELNQDTNELITLIDEYITQLPHHIGGYHAQLFAKFFKIKKHLYVEGKLNYLITLKQN